MFMNLIKFNFYLKKILEFLITRQIKKKRINKKKMKFKFVIRIHFHNNHNNYNKLL